MKKLQKPNCKKQEIYQCYTNESTFRNNVITAVVTTVLTSVLAR